MTFEEYMEKHNREVNNMTLSKARDIISESCSHSDMRIEFEKAVQMLLDCADREIKMSPKTKVGKWILKQRGNFIDIVCSECGYPRGEGFAYGYKVYNLDLDACRGYVKEHNMFYCEKCGIKIEEVTPYEDT